MNFYPDRLLIAEKLYNGIISGKKFVFMTKMNKRDYKTLFKKFPFNEQTESYTLGDHLMVTNPKLRNIIDIIREFGFNIGKNGGNSYLSGVIYYNKDLQDKMYNLRKFLSENKSNNFAMYNE